MFSQLFRTFQPLRNPIGFGPADFVELLFAILLVGFALAWRYSPKSRIHQFAARTRWCMAFVGALPIVLRFMLLPRHPVPEPGVADDFSYLLLADTLSHFRLANPMHPLHQFFETFFVLQEPSYSSVYPIGQGIALAVGTLLGNPWIGVCLSIGAFCALLYWMLRAWLAPEWALLGGVLAALQFGPLNQWMNSYWGGAVSACAGCLVFGALPRLTKNWRMRDAILLGIGLSIQLLTRQYESVLLVMSVAVFFLPALLTPRKTFVIPVLAAVLATTPAIALTLFHDKSVTGSWLTLPNSLSREQYGVPAAFTTQPNPVPHRTLTHEQALDFQLQSSIHGEGTDTFKTFFARLGTRVRYYRFFFLAPLYLTLPFFLLKLREIRYLCVAATLLIFALGTNFYPYFYSHYVAAIACLFVLVSIAGLERLSRWSPDAARWIVYLCIAHFLFWYGLHLVSNQDFAAAVIRYEPWDAINRSVAPDRAGIARQLQDAPGKQLVFVRYYPRHTLDEWVYNAADVDGSQVVWARDLGATENEKLRGYYPDRKVWLVEPDFRPARLTPYPPAE